MTSTETLKETLKQWENFWIMKLETLAPLGLNQDLNWINFMQIFCSPPLLFVSAYGLKYLKSVIKWHQIFFSTCKSQIWHITWERPQLKLVAKNSLFLLVVSPFHLVQPIYKYIYIYIIYYILYIYIIYKISI